MAAEVANPRIQVIFRIFGPDLQHTFLAFLGISRIPQQFPAWSSFSPWTMSISWAYPFWANPRRSHWIPSIMAGQKAKKGHPIDPTINNRDVVGNYTYIYIYIYICLWYMYNMIFLYVIDTYVCIYICIYTVHTIIHMYIYIYIYIYNIIYIYVCIHTHTRNLSIHIKCIFIYTCSSTHTPWTEWSDGGLRRAAGHHHDVLLLHERPQAGSDPLDGEVGG